jgi:hypothetical protein
VDGSLRSIAGVRPPTPAKPHVDASIPRDTFLHLVFGNRTIVEVERTVPDCLLNTDAGALLLDVLFPPLLLSRWEFC